MDCSALASEQQLQSQVAAALTLAERMQPLSPPEAELMQRTAAAALQVPLLPDCWSAIFDFADPQTFGRMRRCSHQWHRIASLCTSSTVLSQWSTIVGAFRPDPTGERLTPQLVQAYLLYRLKSVAWPVKMLELRGVEELYSPEAEPHVQSAAETRLRTVVFEVLSNIAAEILRQRTLGSAEDRRMLALASASSAPLTVLEQLAFCCLQLRSLEVDFTDIEDVEPLLEALSPTLSTLAFRTVRPVARFVAPIPRVLAAARLAAQTQGLHSKLERLTIDACESAWSPESTPWADHAIGLAALYGANLTELQILTRSCSADKLASLNAFTLPKLRSLELYATTYQPLPTSTSTALATLALQHLVWTSNYALTVTQLRALAGEAEDSATAAEWTRKLRAAQDSGAAPHLSGFTAQSLLQRCSSGLRSLCIGNCSDFGDAEIVALHHFRQLRELDLRRLRQPPTLAQYRLLDRTLPLESIREIHSGESRSDADVTQIHSYLALTFPMMLQPVVSDAVAASAFRDQGMQALQLDWQQSDPAADRNWNIQTPILWRDAAGKLHAWMKSGELRTLVADTSS